MIGSNHKTAVGIRPVTDGRRGGVRESLESQTLALAQAAAKLLTASLRHRDGSKVECVLPERCIGGASEAATTDILFSQKNVGLTLTVTPCWCYGSETMDMDPLRPKAVWGFNGTERPGAVYLAAVLAAHAQKGLPAFGIYGRDVQEAGDLKIPADVSEKLLRFARAGLAVATLRGQAYLAMGGTSMGIAGSIVDPDFFESYLGMRVESVDMTEFVRRMERGIFDAVEKQKALAWTKKNCREGKDWNSPRTIRPRARLEKEWERSVEMALIARDLMVGNPALAKAGFGEEALGHHAIAAGFQGQRQWTDHFPNGDYMEAILNSSFDWNGRRAPYLLATENDALNGVGMLFGNLLTHTAQIFADVRTYWSPQAVKRVTGAKLTGTTSGGFLHLINSGPAALDGAGRQKNSGKPAMKPFWEISDAEEKACLEATTWHPSITEYFPGGGWSTRFLTPGGMPCTIHRLNLVRGLGPVLQIAEGQTVDLPAKVNQILEERTNPTWPTTWFVPRTGGNGTFRDVYSVMNAWGANHCVLTYGHVGADLISLASLLRIPVHMHNLDAEKIFRPASWNAFGTADLESADFRACSTYGPLYR